jgi:hypothetical protein
VDPENDDHDLETAGRPTSNSSTAMPQLDREMCAAEAERIEAEQDQIEVRTRTSDA